MLRELFISRTERIYLLIFYSSIDFSVWRKDSIWMVFCNLCWIVNFFRIASIFLWYLISVFILSGMFAYSWSQLVCFSF
jgi:hypothetical protein